jgi:hypothetical protein
MKGEGGPASFGVPPNRLGVRIGKAPHVMKLPTARELNPVPEDLDGQCAEEHFLGKSVEEAEALFRENSLHYYEDLLWMGMSGFRFYVPALINYIQCEEATGNSDIVSCFAGLLENRLRREPAEFVPVAELLASTCAWIVEHYDRFDVDPDIYGDVRSRFETLEQTFSQMKMRG